MTAFRTHHRPFALWLALAAVLYRALIPAGFMPATAEQARQGAVLVLCSGGLLKQSQEPGHPAAHAYEQCAFAAAAAPALPPSVAAAASFPAAFTVPAAAQPAAQSLPQLALPPVRGPPQYA